MKIAIYYHARADVLCGGDTVFQDVLIEELCQADTGHEVVLLSPIVPAVRPAGRNVSFVKVDCGYEGPFAETVEAARRFILVVADRVLNREVTLFSGLDKAVREHGIDMVWFISNTTERVTVPYIATVWDLAHRVTPFFPEVSVTGWKWKLRERHYRELLPRAAGVITGTTAGREEITRFYQVPEELVHVVPFPTPRFALDDTAGAPVTGLPERYLFYPAQFWPHKNHVGLLHALRILTVENRLDFHLVLTGSDKGNLAYVRETAETLGVSDRVHFPGFVDAACLKTIYRKAFALVFPTFFGPDNLPPLEAFALGCPVVASRVSGAAEQLGDAALLFDPKNPIEIAGRVKELYENPQLREELIRRGYERGRRWTAADYVGRVFDIIDRFEPVRRCWR